jgi:hypothetical protein
MFGRFHMILDVCVSSWSTLQGDGESGIRKCFFLELCLKSRRRQGPSCGATTCSAFVTSETMRKGWHPHFCAGSVKTTASGDDFCNHTPYY